MSEWDYKVVALPRTIAVMKKAFKETDPAAIVADYVQKVISDGMAGGWEFYRIDTVNLHESAGCLGGLLGQKDTTTGFNVVTFRKAKT
jgi:hypothetical protein